MIPSAMIDDLIDEAVDKALETDHRKLAHQLIANGKLTDEEISAISGIPKEQLRSKDI